MKKIKKYFISRKYTKICPSFKNVIVRGNPTIELGKNCSFYSNVIIWGNGLVKIDDNSKIGDNTIIYSSDAGGVIIGKNCLIAANCYIIDCNHNYQIADTPIFQQGNTIKKIVIEDNCWIGANCTIGAGTALKKQTVVGANAFVSGEFGPYEVVGGVPARKIKKFN